MIDILHWERVYSGIFRVRLSVNFVFPLFFQPSGFHLQSPNVHWKHADDFDSSNAHAAILRNRMLAANSAVCIRAYEQRRSFDETHTREMISLLFYDNGSNGERPPRLEKNEFRGREKHGGRFPRALPRAFHYFSVNADNDSSRQRSGQRGAIARGITRNRAA